MVIIRTPCCYIKLIVALSALTAFSTLEAARAPGSDTANLTVRPLPADYRIHPDGAVTLRVCFNWSCFSREIITFTPEDMATVSDHMAFCSGGSLHDRLQRVRIGIWRMEELAKKYVPVLANDQAINDQDADLDGRTDCVDNATNTTNFLRVLSDLSLLGDLTVVAPRVRDRFDFGAVHWTAVVVDGQNGEQWSVDSWFRPHGHLPFVMPLDSWLAGKKGWEPPFDATNPYPRLVKQLCPTDPQSRMVQAAPAR